MSEPLKAELPVGDSELESFAKESLLNGKTLDANFESEHVAFAEYLSPEFTDRLSSHMRKAVRKAILNRGP